MSDLNLEQLAEQFDELSAIISKIAGTFRPAAVPAKKPASAGKAAGSGKPAKPSAKVEAAEDDLTEDTVREALRGLVDAKGKEVMLSALESFGAGKLSDVDESQYAELMVEIERLTNEAEEEAEEEAEDEPPAKKAPAKKTAKKKAGPTLDEVQTAARALIDADKPAYVKLTKKLGKPSEMDESDYAAALAAYEAAMPEDIGQDEDDEV